MSNELRFSFVRIIMQLWKSLIRRSLCKPVRPSLHLSKKALETPLPKGLLSDIRDFLTRSGPWKDHPIDSVEVFMAIPAPGVSIQTPLPSVVGFDEPVFTSLGFGMEGITDGVTSYTTGVCEVLKNDASCDTLICITQTTQKGTRLVPSDDDQGLISLKTCYDSHCKKNVCLDNDCKSQKCSAQTCGTHDCTDHLCGTQNSCGIVEDKATRFSIVSEFEEHWQHPFVQELNRYFGIDNLDDLAAATKEYIGRNMYDESAQVSLNRTQANTKKTEERKK